ncbi:MAG: 16S rRNA (guanine(527)-N(7))-methyltransferase RsmG [Bacilli bacterium]|nr:16S rRNA (guanine(527)-N(7))-methyltransferase RsmG [Bacilli bacterium]
MTKDSFLEELKKLNIFITEDQLTKLDKFYQLLINWNEKINLTTITKEEDVYLKHFYDSLTLKKAIDLTKDITLLDVGTGAGFPGIVLKIVFPNLKITLLDSLNKRINYLNEIIKELELSNIETICSRCEDYTKINREKYDVVVARAVSHLEILSELIIPTVKVNGYFVAMKSNVQDEIEISKNILSKLDSIVEKVIEFNLPIENSIRTLVKIKKNKITNVKYPRKYDQIKKSHCKK